MNGKSGLFEILAKIRSKPGMYLGKPSIQGSLTTYPLRQIC